MQVLEVGIKVRGGLSVLRNWCPSPRWTISP